MTDEYDIRLDVSNDVVLDVNAQVATLLNNYLRTEIIPQCPHLSLTDERWDLDDTARIKFPRPNYPPTPAPRINEIYWPTGAGRWARGWFLVDGDNALATVARVDNGDDDDLTNRGVYVEISGDSSQNYPFNMFLLESREITASQDAAALSTNADDRLWLVHLVDQRYFWQFQTVDFTGIDDTTTWADLFVQTETDTGLVIEQDSIHANYGKPDYTSFKRKMNVAVALDAIAHSLGHRVIVDYETTQGQTYSTVRTISDDANYNLNIGLNDPVQWDQSKAILGSNLWPPKVPKSVVVSFRRANNKIPGCDQATKDVEIQASATTQGPNYPYVDANIKHQVWSTQWALFDNAADMTANNQSTLNSLAQRIAEDYYAKFTNRIDQTLPGIIPWMQSANDDFVLFNFGTEGEPHPVIHSPEDGPPEVTIRRQRIVSTRVCSVAPNFGTRFQLSNDATVYDIRRGDDLIATTETVISAASDTTPGSGEVSIRRLDSNGDYETIITDLVVYNDCKVTIGAATRVQLKQDAWCTFWIDVECCVDGS